MDAPNPPASDDPTPSDVPEDLMKKLHEATEKFHQARQRVEEVMDDSGYRHQERLNQKNEDLKKAEKEVEEIDQQIHQKLQIEPSKAPPREKSSDQ